ncbi:MAG TPA: alkaline phosphatase family protein, partial [Vicinamibacterales bacterium]
MASKVLLVVIDAATPHVVCPAVQTGRLPVMRRLAESGDMHTQSVSMFPSITPAATSTIITGAYPCEHGIAGAAWFDTAKNEVAYYGDDFWIIAREGFGHFINDFLLRLNGDRMRAPTLFQMVERTGRTAGSLNYLVYKGNVLHKVNVPKLMATLPGVPLSETVEGPSLLCLGDFVGTRTPHGHKPKEKGGLLHRFGMDDASTASMLKDLAGKHALPDLTVAYFADNDYVSHEVGPVAALPVVQRVDEALGETFEAFGGMDRFLEETAVIITSDHGHCDILDSPAAVIRLDQVLADFKQAALGAAWKAKDEIMICPNMRAAQIYVRQPRPEIIELLASTLLTHPDVDQVIWHSRLTGGDGHYTVMSSRGRLTFSREASSNGATDEFDGEWSWSGEGTALGLSQD